jgi:ADP-heptose:LPS heptosyltransferase
MIAEALRNQWEESTLCIAKVISEIRQKSLREKETLSQSGTNVLFREERKVLPFVDGNQVAGEAYPVFPPTRRYQQNMTVSQFKESIVEKIAVKNVLQSINLRQDRGILILNHHGFGNVVMSIPLLKAISDWVAGRWPIKVFFNSVHHFELVREEGLDIEPIFHHPDHSEVIGLVNLWKIFSHKIDMIICVPQTTWYKPIILKTFLGSRYIAGEVFPIYRRIYSFSAEKGWNKPILKSQEELVTSMKIDMASNVPSINLTNEELQWAKEIFNKYGLNNAKPIIGFNCSASAKQKKWPAEYFGYVASALKKKYPNLAVISFGDNSDRADADIAHHVAGNVDWVEGTGLWTIRESLAILKQCDLVISGDTSSMHMAAALGVKTIGIFGQTSPNRLAPTYNGGMVVVPEMPCHPCYKDKYKNCNCIHLISPIQVISAAERCLGVEKLNC